MRNIRPCLNRLAVIIQNILRQVRFDRVGLGHPFGIEHQIGGGHGQRVQICLGTLKATRRRVPTGEYIRVLFKLIRIIRFKVIAAQRSFVLYAPALASNYCVIVVERQIVAVAGIVQVVVLLHSDFPVFWEIGVGIALCEAGDGVKFLGVSQACARTVCKIDHLVLLVVFPVKGGIARCPVQRFHVVVNLCAGFGGILLKRDVFARHGIDRTEVVAGHKGLTPIRHLPPDGFVSVFDGEIAVDICTVFCRNGQVRVFVALIAVGILG